MSFFKVSRGEVVGDSGWRAPERVSSRGDRALGVRVDEPEVPEHRRRGVTLSRRGEVGLTNAVVLDRMPRGCLLKLGVGWFDLDGYWCIPKADRRVEVRRGADRGVMRRLTPEQRRDLERARLQARRKGVR